MRRHFWQEFSLSWLRAGFYAGRPIIAACLLLVGVSSCSLLGFGGSQDSKPKSVYHYVKRGETLYGIGKRYGVYHVQIARLNGLRDPNKLYVGQRLLIRYNSIPGTSGSKGSSGSGYMPASYRGGNIGDRGGKLSWPLNTGRVVGWFGPRWNSFHDGIDVAAPSGTPVYAAHDGQVVYSNDDLTGYGKLIILKHQSGLVSIYGHNRRLLVTEGQRVRRGAKIAEVGSTGRSSGPHLHFEVRLKNKRGAYVAVDPLPLLEKNPKKRPNYRINESLTPILAKWINRG